MRKLIIVIAAAGIIFFIIGELAISANTKETNLRSRVLVLREACERCLEDSALDCYDKQEALRRAKSSYNKFVQHSLEGRIFTKGESIDESLKKYRCRLNNYFWLPAPSPPDSILKLLR